MAKIQYGVKPDIFKITQDSRSAILSTSRSRNSFQDALSTRAGTECVAHVVQALTSLDKGATILSIDGVGAHTTRFPGKLCCEGWQTWMIGTS